MGVTVIHPGIAVICRQISSAGTGQSACINCNESDNLPYPELFPLQFSTDFDQFLWKASISPYSSSDCYLFHLLEQSWVSTPIQHSIFICKHKEKDSGKSSCCLPFCFLLALILGCVGTFFCSEFPVKLFFCPIGLP